MKARGLLLRMDTIEGARGTAAETRVATTTVIRTAGEAAHSTRITEGPLHQNLMHRFRGDNPRTCTQNVVRVDRPMLVALTAVLEVAVILWKGKPSVHVFPTYLLTLHYSRRVQRENQVVNVWPPSPKAPARGSCAVSVSTILPLLTLCCS